VRTSNLTCHKKFEFNTCDRCIEFEVLTVTEKSSVIWDILGLLPGSCQFFWFAYSLTLKMEVICQLTFTMLHSVIFQKIELFVGTIVGSCKGNSNKNSFVIKWFHSFTVK
jgi:hypothetical protein